MRPNRNSPKRSPTCPPGPSSPPSRCCDSPTCGVDRGGTTKHGRCSMNWMRARTGSPTESAPRRCEPRWPWTPETSSRRRKAAERDLRALPSDDIVEHVDGGEALVRARLGLGDREEAQRPADTLRSIAEATPTARLCVASMAAGLVSAARGEHADARGSLEPAIAVYRAGGATFETARAQMNWRGRCPRSASISAPSRRLRRQSPPSRGWVPAPTQHPPRRSWRTSSRASGRLPNRTAQRSGVRGAAHGRCRHDE